MSALYGKSKSRMCEKPNRAKMLELRDRFWTEHNPNLENLLELRYGWIKKHCHGIGIEIGSGLGLSQYYVPQLQMTDIVQYPWIHAKLDAMDMFFGDGEVRYIVANNVLHHFSHPAKFLKECNRVLRRRGRVIVYDISAGWLMRRILNLMRHEGYDYSRDVWGEEAVNDPDDPWSANCAVSNMLFGDHEKLENETGLRVVHDSYAECLSFLLSGGVNYRTFRPPLTRGMLKIVNMLDEVITKWPAMALQRRVVLEKT